MFRRRYISVVLFAALLVISSMMSSQASAVQGWRTHPKKVEPALEVSQDLSGEGQAMESAKRHISNSDEGIAETQEKFIYQYEAEPWNEGGPLKLSLESCIQRALESNMKLKASDQDIEAAEGQLIEAKAAFWPVMEYNYRMAPVPVDVDDAWNKFWAGDVTFFNSIHVGIGVPLLTFGQLHMAKKMAQGGLEAARIRYRQAEGDVVYQVKRIYYGIQLAHESRKLLDEAIGKLSDKIEGETKKQEEEDEEDELADVEEGDAYDPYDILQMKAFKAELERRRAEVEQNLELAYDALRIQLDLDPGARVALDDNTLKPKLASLDREEEFIDGGMRHQHEVKLLDIGVDVKQRQYKLEKYKLFPRAGFGFFVDIGRSAGEIRGLQLTDDYNDPFNYTRAGIGLQLKGTLDFHGAYGRIKKARAEYHKSVYERMIARRGLTTDIRKAYLEAKRAQEDVARTKKEWSMANQMMFLSKVNMDIGIGDKDRYADALKYVLLSRGRYFKSVYDYNMALAELEKRVGRERYDNYVPTPDIDELEAFRYNGEEDEGGWVTINGSDDTYGRETEDGGTTDGSFEE